MNLIWYSCDTKLRVTWLLNQNFSKLKSFLNTIFFFFLWKEPHISRKKAEWAANPSANETQQFLKFLIVFKTSFIEWGYEW